LSESCAAFEERLSSEGYIVLGKRLEASVEHLDELLFHIRDIDLEAFIEDQQSKGTMLTRTQAIRLVLRTYLSEKGFVRGPRARQSNESMPKE
jgi:hypothetical protein